MKNTQVMLFERILYIADNKMIMKKSPFFYEVFRLKD